MSSIEVFQATPADARAIGALRARNWKEQYGQLVTPEWMDQEMERIAGEKGSSQRAYWISLASLPGASNFWLVAKTKDGALAGYLEARKYSRDKQELRSLHLAEGMRGRGIGQKLLTIAHDTWFDPRVAVFLDVAKLNVDGQRFYQREPNCYKYTGREFPYGQITMLEMMREPQLR